MMDVSIIYVNYKTNKILIDSILSVKQKTLNCTYEIIVVDNSDDEMIHRDLKDKIYNIDNSIIIVDAKENLGFGRANNLGVKYAKGRNILFLNTDTLLVNDTISILNNYLDNNVDVGIVGPNILDKDMRPAHSFYKNEKNIDNYRINNSLCKSIKNKLFNKRSDYNYNDRPLEISGYICGACMMMRKDLFEQMRGFDRDIFMYAEETLLNYRVIHEANKKVFNIPSARIIHLEGTSFDENSVNRIKMMVDGNWIYFTKAFGVEEALKYVKKEIFDYKVKGIIKFIVSGNKNNYFLLMSKAWKKKLECK